VILILQLYTPTRRSIAVPPTSLLIKKTLSGNKVINSLQELRKDDWWAIKAYIYITYIYLTRIKLFD
jgi:hypothetical protein